MDIQDWISTKIMDELTYHTYVHFGSLYRVFAWFDYHIILWGKTPEYFEARARKLFDALSEEDQENLRELMPWVREDGTIDQEQLLKEERTYDK